MPVPMSCYPLQGIRPQKAQGLQYVLHPASPKRRSSSQCEASPSAKGTLVTREQYKTFTNVSGMQMGLS